MFCSFSPKVVIQLLIPPSRIYALVRSRLPGFSRLLWQPFRRCSPHEDRVQRLLGVDFGNVGLEIIQGYVLRAVQVEQVVLALGRTSRMMVLSVSLPMVDSSSPGAICTSRLDSCSSLAEAMRAYLSAVVASPIRRTPKATTSSPAAPA